MLPWRSMWSADNPVERLNVHMSLLVGLMMTAGLYSTSSMVPISGGLIIALELTGMGLSFTKGGPMLYMPRLCVSLVSEAGMF